MNRLIEDIRDFETRKEYKVDQLLSRSEEEIFRLRRLLAENRAKNTKSLVCAICNQAVIIAGNQKREFFFKHHQDSDDCYIKTAGKLGQEEINALKYQGAKESKRHKELKSHISTFLRFNKNISELAEEKVIKSTNKNSKEWKKPDISSIYKKNKVVFEIQLSTTFLNVIVDREIFYKNEQTYIIWFFNLSSFSEYRFTEKDILYSNKNNALIINDETIEKTQNNNELIFLCHYKKAYLDQGIIKSKWDKKYITIDDLQFDESNYKAYYYDYALEHKKLEDSLKHEFLNEFKDYWLKRDQLNFELREKNDLHYKNKFAEINIDVDGFSNIRGILNALFSLKTKNIIGFKFSNYLALSNHILYDLPEFSKIYLWAVYVYGYKEIIENQDKKDTFKGKIQKYKKERPEQDTKHSELIYKLFPEIKNILDS